jgi:hypothetical protein
MAEVKKNPSAPHVARLAAVMDLLEYGYRGGQKAFADEINVDPNRFNNIVKGSPLSKGVAFALIRRFRQLSLEFLWFGLPGYGQADFEKKLMEWERRTGRRIFIDLPGP